MQDHETVVVGQHDDVHGSEKKVDDHASSPFSFHEEHIY